MIKTETITFNGKQFKHTYSDAGYMIECDGVQYADAVDVLDSTREYTETTVSAETGEVTNNSYIEPLEAEMDSKLEEQAEINAQQDDMITELYESLIGGEA
jgi:hypothetical protein